MIGSIDLDAIGDAAAEPVAKSKGSGAEENIRFTANDVRETLTMLFNQGNRYSIYLLVLATSEKTIDMIHSGITSKRDYCIYASLGDLRGKKDVKSGAGCAYLVPDGVKARLIQYKPKDLERIIRRFN